MSKAKILALLSLALGLAVVSTVEISAKSTHGENNFVIRRIEPQVVLYTIYRGSYDKIGTTVGKLFALAGRKGIRPRGPVSHVYLNNPERISSRHWLTEIRIPIGEEALKFTGTLGEMTDVKALPAMEVAVAIKPQGQADPAAIYQELPLWILGQGYIGTAGPIETFPTSGMTSGNYAQMKTEIWIPVEKLFED